MVDIDLDTSVVSKKEIVSSDMDGEKVMLSIETGKYYNLGKTGGVIWNLIDKPIKVEEVVQQLMEEYKVGREQCEKEVLSFLMHIYNEKLVECIQ